MFQHEILSSPPTLQARWLRIPAATAYSGLSRARLYVLLAEGQIKSASICGRGKRRGIRIVDKESLDAFLEKNLTGAAK
jgi:hypothetical protein